MSDQDTSETQLANTTGSALVPAKVVSLVRRGMDDLLRLDNAESWYEEGLRQWAKEDEEQEHTGARVVCPLDELDMLDEEGYRSGFECFQRGFALNPNHIGILDCI